MTPEVRQQIYAHALAEFPRECCGLVVGNEYVRCRNIATTPSEHFILAPEDYANAEDKGEVTMVVHSHPNLPARASEGDKVSCEASGLPWLIVSVIKQPEDVQPRIAGDAMIAPCGYEAPLIGRTFCFGVLDCFTLIRDWYMRTLGIELPNFERRDNFWADGVDQELYLDNYRKAGFVDVTDGSLEVGDILMMKVRSPKSTNHAGVYIGKGLFLHHLYGKLSSREVYGGYWAEVTRKIVRRAA
jgi:proteasome lid subunit RPN8/RPN11